MRFIALLIVASLFPTAASADTVIAGVQANIVFGEVTQGVTGVRIFFDDTLIAFNPDFSIEGTMLPYAGAEFPWNPAPGGSGLRFEFESAPGQVFDIELPIGASVGAGGHDLSTCTTNLSDPCGAHLQQSVDDPTFTFMTWNLNDFIHENVSLSGGINVKTTVGFTINFYGGIPVPEPTCGTILSLGACASFLIRRRTCT